MPALLSAFVAALAGVTSPSPSSGQEPTIEVRLVNQSKHTLVRAHVSGSAVWGPNLLGVRRLQPGESMALRFAGACGKHDVRIVALKGVEFLLDDQELCTAVTELVVQGRIVRAKARQP